LRSEFVTNYLPRKAITRIIRPMGKDVQFGKDPVGAILDEGIVGTSLKSMGEKVAAKLKSVGKQIDTIANDPKYANTSVDLNQVYGPLNDAIDAAEKAGDKKLFRRLSDVREELRSEWQATIKPKKKPTLKRVGRRPNVMPPADALQFRRMIGKRIRWSDDALDEPVNGALGGVYGKVRDALNDAIPDPKWKSLNKSYSNLVSAEKAIERRLPVEERQALVSLFDLVAGISTVPFLGAKAIPLILARKATELPIVKSTVAQGAYRLGSREIGTDPVTGIPIYSRGYVPQVSPPVTVPAVAVARGQQTRRQLQEEAKKRAPVGSQASVQAAPATSPTAAAAKPSPTHPDTGGGFARAISVKEGFGTPGTIPTQANNPGALELGNIGYGTLKAANGQRITVFRTQADGWKALNKQLNLILSGKSPKYPNAQNMTLSEFGKTYSGGEAKYGADIADALGIDPSTTLGELAPTQQAAALQ
jgi:hypothetical protein